jgi:hypothetical protein
VVGEGMQNKLLRRVVEGTINEVLNETFLGGLLRHAGPVAMALPFGVAENQALLVHNLEQFQDSRVTPSALFLQLLKYITYGTWTALPEHMEDGKFRIRWSF